MAEPGILYLLLDAQFTALATRPSFFVQFLCIFCGCNLCNSVIHHNVRWDSVTGLLESFLHGECFLGNPSSWKQSTTCLCYVFLLLHIRGEGDWVGGLKSCPKMDQYSC